MKKITLIGPSHRTQLWRNFCDSIVTNVNQIEWSVCFVTDIEPLPEHVEGLPPNFKWIVSPVKPAQCFEIAYRSTDSDFISWCGDDFIWSPYAFDNAYNMYRSFYDHKVMISYNVFEDGVNVMHNHCTHWTKNPKQLTTSALISRQAIEEVGGLADRNFVAGHWDCDLMMRIYANGGRLYICPNACAYEPHIQFHKKEANFALDWKWEFDLFDRLWCENGMTTLNRKGPFDGYKSSLEELIQKTEGNSGLTDKWKPKQ